MSPLFILGGLALAAYVVSFVACLRDELPKKPPRPRRLAQAGAIPAFDSHTALELARQAQDGQQALCAAEVFYRAQRQQQALLQQQALQIADQAYLAQLGLYGAAVEPFGGYHPQSLSPQPPPDPVPDPRTPPESRGR